MTARVRSNVAGVMALVWMSVIFAFSAQNKEESSAVSEEISDRLLSVSGWLFHLHIDEEKVFEILRSVEHVVRKGAHMTEFAILAILLYLWIGRWQILRLRRYSLAVALTVFYAASDEFHQLFVEGRAGRVSDVLIDGCGAVLGLALFLLLIHWGMLIAVRRRINVPVFRGTGTDTGQENRYHRK